MWAPGNCTSVRYNGPMGTQSITVKHDIGAVQVFLDELATQAIKKAVATSIRRTFAMLKTSVSKEIVKRKLVNTRSLPQREIKSRQYIRETQKIAPSMPIDSMEARLDFRNKKPGIVHFWAKRVAVYRARPSGKGRTRARGFGQNPLSAVQVTIMGKSYVVGKAFMPGTTGLRTVFMRQTKKRTPLRVVHGPSFATMFDKMGIALSLQGAAQARYSQEFEHQFEYFLKQLTDRQAAKAAKGD